jgi:hypothetical protein
MGSDLLPANSRFLTGLSARLGMTKSCWVRSGYAALKRPLFHGCAGFAARMNSCPSRTRPPNRGGPITLAAWTGEGARPHTSVLTAVGYAGSGRGTGAWAWWVRSIIGTRRSGSSLFITYSSTNQRIRSGTSE